MKKQKKQTVEDVRNYVSLLQKEEPELTWDEAVSKLHGKFDKQLIIKYVHST